MIKLPPEEKARLEKLRPDLNYNPKGAPSTYKEEYVNKVKEYLESINTNELPTREGFALSLGTHTEVLEDWARAHNNFRLAIKEIDEEQKKKLMVDGMYGGREVNSSMAIFLLKANHGMIETEKRILVGDKNEPVAVSVIEDKVKSDEF